MGLLKGDGDATPIGVSRLPGQAVLEIVKATHSTQSRAGLGDRLIACAEYALATRQSELLGQVAAILTGPNFPARHRIIAHYYLAVYMVRMGQSAQASSMLERLIVVAPPIYQARSLLSLAFNQAAEGNLESSCALYQDAGRLAADCDLRTAAQAYKMISVLLSMRGDNRRAVEAMDSISTVVKAVASSYPLILPDYLNTYALILAELGRYREARHMSRIAAASPFSTIYTEWRETRSEIDQQCPLISHSTVAFSKADPLELPHQAASVKPETTREIVARLPVRPLQAQDSSAGEPKQADSPARVLTYSGWNSPTKALPDHSVAKADPLDRYTSEQLKLRIGRATLHPEATMTKLRKMVVAVERILNED